MTALVDSVHTNTHFLWHQPGSRHVRHQGKHVSTLDISRTTPTSTTLLVSPFHVIHLSYWQYTLQNECMQWSCIVLLQASIDYLDLNYERIRQRVNEHWIWIYELWMNWRGIFAYFNFISWGSQFYLNIFFLQNHLHNHKLFLNYIIMFHEYVEA